MAGRYDMFPRHAYREAYQISNTNADPEGQKAVALLFRDAEHVRVSGKGAVFMHRGKMMEVCIDQSREVQIEGLAFDYHRPTVSEYRVEKVGEGFADLVIHKDSKFEVRDGVLHWIGEGWSKTTGLEF